MEGQVIEVAAVCKGNSEKVCTEHFDQEIERIKLLQRKLYSLKEALAMFWDYHFFQSSVPSFKVQFNLQRLVASMLAQSADTNIK